MRAFAYGAVALLLALAAGGADPHFRPTVDLPAGVQADNVLVRKADRALVLLRNGEPLKTYRIALGRVPRDAKQRQSDGRTPGGVYGIDSRNSQSAYHLALHRSYPNASDRKSNAPCRTARRSKFDREPSRRP